MKTKKEIEGVKMSQEVDWAALSKHPMISSIVVRSGRTSYEEGVRKEHEGYVNINTRHFTTASKIKTFMLWVQEATGVKGFKKKVTPNHVDYEANGLDVSCWIWGKSRLEELEKIAGCKLKETKKPYTYSTISCIVKES